MAECERVNRTLTANGALRNGGLYGERCAKVRRSSSRPFFSASKKRPLSAGHLTDSLFFPLYLSCTCLP